jgi:hypothetical protein
MAERELTVQGVVVTADHQQLLVERMKVGSFKASNLETYAESLGFDRSDGLAMRVADRLIQRERKAGNVELSNRQWSWKGPR